MPELTDAQRGAALAELRPSLDVRQFGALLGHANISDWQQPGSNGEHQRIDGSGAVDVVGRLIKAEPPARLVITFDDAPGAESRREPSVVTFLAETHHDIVRLTVTHQNLAKPPPGCAPPGSAGPPWAPGPTWRSTTGNSPLPTRRRTANRARPGRPHPGRAAGGPPRRRRPHQPANRRRAVRQHQDRRVPPRARLGQARHPLPQRPHHPHRRPAAPARPQPGPNLGADLSDTASAAGRR